MTTHRRDLIAAHNQLVDAVDQFLRSAESWERLTPESLMMLVELKAAREAVAVEQQRLDAAKASNHRPTSKATSRSDLPKPSTRLTIIEIVTAHWTHFQRGITVETLTRRLRGKHQTVSAAVNHLMERGWLIESGEIDQTDPKHPKILWAPSELAIHVMREKALEAAR